MDITQNTGKYMHGADDVVHLSFPSGGVPRSFSVIKYQAIDTGQVAFTSGVAIIDNDNLSVVLDGHLASQADKQADFLFRVQEMSWRDFSGFCTSHPRFRGKLPDAELARPAQGSLTNQVQRGVAQAPKSPGDMRTPSMIAADADPACPYTFPQMTRQEMIRQIADHDVTLDEDGKWRLCWPINLTSETAVMAKTKGLRITDEVWRLHYEANPEVFHQVLDEMMAPYFMSAVGTWPKSDAGRYDFGAFGDGEKSALYLKSIDGVDFGFSTRGELGQIMDGLDDRDVLDIWKIMTCTDQDMAPDRLEKDFSLRLNKVRAQFDRDYGKSVEIGEMAI